MALNNIRFARRMADSLRNDEISKISLEHRGFDTGVEKEGLSDRFSEKSPLSIRTRLSTKGLDISRRMGLDSWDSQ